MARKRWEDLSPKYRARLERQGITKQSHGAGATLPESVAKKARRTAQRQAKERAEKQKHIREWRNDVIRMYHIPPEEIRELQRRLSVDEMYAAIVYQEKMQELYVSGRFAKAREMWDNRDKSLPDWMFFYHSYFS